MDRPSPGADRGAAHQYGAFGGAAACARSASGGGDHPGGICHSGAEGRRAAGADSLSAWLFHTARLTAANFQRTEIRRARREQEAYMQSGTREYQTNDPWGQMAPLLERSHRQPQ